VSKQKQITPRSSAAEYLIFAASTNALNESIEVRYEDENLWLTQKLISKLYGVEVSTINYHIKKIFTDAELEENRVIRNFRITAEIAKAHAETEFEKYRIIQDRLFESDFDRILKKLPPTNKED
jgi:hypothetical protein